MEVKKNLRIKSKPSRPLMDMYKMGLLNGSILEFGHKPKANLKFLSTAKPNTVISGFDPNAYNPPNNIRYDTIFSNYIFNYLATKEEIDYFFRIVKKKLDANGILIVVARSIAEVKGNTKRTGNWTFDPKLNGYVSTGGVFQRGYDNNELDKLIESYGFEVITDQYEFDPKPYSFTICRKNPKMIA